MVFGINLLPQEDRFFDLISENSEMAYRCVMLMRQLVLEEDPQKIDKLGHDIVEAKRRAKAITQELSERLCQTFITPIDREDIQALAYGLYKIPKTCEKAQERIRMFNMRPFHDDLVKITTQMAEAAEPLHDMLKHLKSLSNTQAVGAQCALISNIENTVDELMSQLLVRLFADEPDAKSVILRRDIYNLLEKIVDRQRDMANLILEIVLKHA